MKVRVGVLGAGTWGTALAIILSENGHDVTLWSAISSEIDEINEKRSLESKLPRAVIPENIVATTDLKTACEEKDLIVFAVASPFVRMTANKAAPFIDRKIPVVNVAKGIEEDTLFTLTDIIEDEFKKENGDIGNVAVLSGPSHAEEVSVHIPTTVVVGAKTKETACFIQDVFMTDRFRVYTSPDIIGIELGGAIKNVIALAAGVLDGLEFGDNSKAALMTRGMSEIGRLGIKMGGKLETFAGLSGIGDLIVTCTSKHSRNHNAGFLIGKGMKADEAMKEVGQVVEGVYAAKAALKLARLHELDMPIVEKINQVLFEDKDPREAVYELLLRDKKKEHKTLKWE